MDVVLRIAMRPSTGAMWNLPQRRASKPSFVGRRMHSCERERIATWDALTGCDIT